MLIYRGKKCVYERERKRRRRRRRRKSTDTKDEKGERERDKGLKGGRAPSLSDTTIMHV